VLVAKGIDYYAGKNPEEAVGLMHWDIGGYVPRDLDVVAAFDIDKRKVGQDLAQAIFAPPKAGVTVRMGRVVDGVSEHMAAPWRDPSLSGKPDRASPSPRRPVPFPQRRTP